RTTGIGGARSRNNGGIRMGLPLPVCSRQYQASAAEPRGSARALSRAPRSRALHPTLALEEAQQEDAGDEQATEAQHEERPRGRDAVSHHPAEVHAEEPGDEGERQEDGADDRELL